ncbi:hypothetical protein [Mariniphaga sp.]|uniref:hypothetical protein n=1 Tax=Mariniphaga sp. TaxID=1954475 RepID=UPI00356A633E
MNYKFLIDSAAKIPVAEKNAVEEYREKSDFLVAVINKQMSIRPDLKELIGENNLEMMKDNHANHVRFIHSILKNPNAEVLVDTVLWVFKAYQNHGFSGSYWAAQLNTWFQILKDELTPESFRQVIPLYEWMQVNIPLFEKLSKEKTDPGLSGH